MIYNYIDLIYNREDLIMFKYISGMACDSLVFFKTTVGRMMREAGLDLDRRGSLRTNDIAFLEPHNRHRNIMPLYQLIPQISPSAYIAPNATVYGNVFVGQNSYFAFGSIAKGDANPIRVGANTKIGENTVLETNILGNDEAYPLSVNIGNNVNIENGCHLMSCIVDDDVHIGHRSVVMEGSQVERG